MLVGHSVLLAAAGKALGAGERVVLRGPPGVGKSAVLDRLVHDRPETVVRVAAARADEGLDLAVVAEILDVLPDGCLDALPEPQRAAAEAVRRHGVGGADPLAVRFGLTGALCEAGALLVIDDVQWLDPASVNAVAYALRRAGDRVGCVIAERTPLGPPITERLGGGWTVLDVAPLPVEEVASLLAAHGLPRRLAGAAHLAGGGFPLWTLEAGKALAAARDARRVRSLIAARLEELPAATRDVLLPMALARRPTLTLLRRAGWRNADVAVRPAIAAGLVTVDGTLGFTGTAIADAVIEEAGWSRRAAAHRALAEAAGDAADRVRHRALADPGPDADLARELAAAAAVARAAGDRAGAAELGLLAAEHTPGGADGATIVSATTDAAAAGRADLVRRGEALLDTMGTPAERARARLAVIRTAGQSLAGHADTLARALADAGGDPALRAEVHVRLAVRANLTEGDPGQARVEAGRACELAAAAGDRALLAAALTMRARVERITGHPDAERSLADALALGPGGTGAVNDSARFLAARHALFDDRLGDARGVLLNLLPVAERTGDAEGIIDVLRGLAEVEVRSGYCAKASSYAARAMELTESAGLSPGPAWYSLAVTEAAGGDLALARRHAVDGAATSEEEQDMLFLARNLHVLGTIELLAGDVDAAVQNLGRVRELERAAGVVDPSLLRWHGDLVIALALTGRPGQARDLLDEVRPIARRLGRTGVRASLDHAEGRLCAAGGGDLAEAAATLARAAERFGSLSLPLEQGRVLLAQAQIARRRRRMAEARAFVARAYEVFNAARARPWLQLTGEAAARLEPAQLAGAPSVDVLTASEKRVAELVSRGASNREIAVALALSVKTVEATLTRIYRKRGVRSRTQLIAALHVPVTDTVPPPAADRADSGG
ncbi:AAA family ATPase [Spirillospora sp. CA-294931]|uniref:helix-turn-helix transcriptional regulator n=1 Tax=Spirillospora sp. CA-294931 TaxID=3240042 RepID=UPI003D922D8A